MFETVHDLDQRRQQTASIADEVVTNVAEYAAMLDITFDEAALLARKEYHCMLCAIYAYRKIRHVL